LALGLVASLLSPEALAGGTPVVYAVNDKGKLSVNGTLLETLPGNFDLDNLHSPKGPERWIDLVVEGSDRYSLRIDGRIERNGALFRELDFAVSDYIWNRLIVDGGAVHAVRSDGLLAVDGAQPVLFENDVYVFVDLLALNGRVYALRSDGSVFVDDQVDCIGKFSGGGTTSDFQEGKGSFGDTHWKRLAVDPISGLVLSVRGDGKLHSLDLVMGSCEVSSMEVVRLPYPKKEENLTRADIYQDLEFAPDGMWHVLREDGAIYRADRDPEKDPVLVVKLPGKKKGKKPLLTFTDFGFLGDEFWSLRGDGRVYRGSNPEHLVELPGKNYLRLGLSNSAPDLTDFDNNLPEAAVYKLRLVEGDALELPIVLSDLDTLEADLLVSVDLSGLPGATFDDVLRVVSWVAGEPGKSSFVVTVDDGSGDGPVSFTYRVIVNPVNPKASNKAPKPSQIMPTQALVGVPLVLPILASDRDGDELTITVDGTQGAFALGATFDSGTGLFSWTPLFEHLGRTEARFFVSDGRATKRMRLKLEAKNPLSF
jgi:hypothetical protein